MNLPSFILSAMLAVAAISMTLLSSGTAAATEAAVCTAASAGAALLWLGQSGWKSRPRWLWLGFTIAAMVIAIARTFGQQTR